MHAKHGRGGDRQRDRHEILDRVIGYLVEHGRISGMVAESKEKRVAVRRRPRYLSRAYHTAGTDNILDIELLPEPLGKLMQDGAGDDVGRATGSERNDDAYGSRGIGLRPGHR